MPSIPFFNCDNKTKKEKSMPPSWFVQRAREYKVWCNVNVCKSCGRRAKYEDMHSANPCPECGNKVKEFVGKWTGEYWLIKGEDLFLDAEVVTEEPAMIDLAPESEPEDSVRKESESKHSFSNKELMIEYGRMFALGVLAGVFTGFYIAGYQVF